MFYWHEASLGNDSFCVLPSHHPGVVTTSCNGCIFQEIFSWYFSPKCFVSKQHFVDKILCHFDPWLVAWACLTFFPVVTLLSWWLSVMGADINTPSYRDLFTLYKANPRSSELNGSSMGSHSMRETQEKPGTHELWASLTSDHIETLLLLDPTYTRHDSDSLKVLTMSRSHWDATPTKKEWR